MLSITLFSCGGDEEVNPVDPTQTEAEIYSDLIGVWEIESIILKGVTFISEGDFCESPQPELQQLFKITVSDDEDGNLFYERIALCTGTSGYIGEIEINDNTIKLLTPEDVKYDFLTGTINERTPNRLSITYVYNNHKPVLVYKK
jgi:hypothetical protein